MKTARFPTHAALSLLLLLRRLPSYCWLPAALVLYALLHLFGSMPYAVAHLPGKVPYAVPYHTAFYAGLAGMLWLSMKRPGILKVVLLVTCAGAIDEFHQSFLPFRGACVSDVLLDAAAGWLGAWCMLRMTRMQASIVMPTAPDGIRPTGE